MPKTQAVDVSERPPAKTNHVAATVVVEVAVKATATVEAGAVARAQRRGRKRRAWKMDRPALHNAEARIEVQVLVIVLVGVGLLHAVAAELRRVSLGRRSSPHSEPCKYVHFTIKQ